MKMKLIIERYRFVISILLGALLLVACSSSSPPEMTEDAQVTSIATNTPLIHPTASPEPTTTVEITQKTVSIWHSWDDTQIPALVEIISNFQELYPDIQFDVLYIPRENLLERYITETQTGGGPGILIGPAQWGPQLFELGLVNDLSSDVGGEVLDELNPAALEQMAYQDALVGLPYAIEGVVLYRNRDIIPESPDTFEDLVSLATSMTKGDIIGADLERGFFFSGGHLSGLGGKLMDENGNPAFNDDKGVSWLEMLIDFEEAGATEFMSDRDKDLFIEGRVGFIIDGTWNMDTYIEALGAGVVAIDPWPKYQDGSLAGYVQSEDLFMNSQIRDENFDAALTFMQYFVSPASQTILSDFGFLPSETGLQLVDSLDDRLLTQALKALAGGTGYPNLPEMVVYLSPMDMALRSVFYDGVLPEDALNTADENIRGALEALRSTSTPSP